MNATQQNQHLEAKVTGRNKVNALLNHWAPILHHALAPLVGLDIYNQDGSIKKKIRDAFPALPNTSATQILWNHGPYSIFARFKVCLPYGEHFCCYVEECLILGDVKGVRLVKLYGLPQKEARTDWTVAEVIALRKESEIAQRAANAALGKISDFGLHDNH